MCSSDLPTPAEPTPAEPAGDEVPFSVAFEVRLWFDFRVWALDEDHAAAMATVDAETLLAPDRIDPWYLGHSYVIVLECTAVPLAEQGATA